MCFLSCSLSPPDFSLSPTLWMRLSRKPTDPSQLFGRIDFGRIYVMIDRGDYWQCALVIRKSAFKTIRQRGLGRFRADLVQMNGLLKSPRPVVFSYRRLGGVALQSGERRPQISTKILHTLDPDREPEQRVRNPRALPRFCKRKATCQGRFSGAVDGYGRRQNHDDPSALYFFPSRSYPWPVTRFSAATYYHGFFGYVRKEARLRVR